MNHLITFAIAGIFFAGTAFAGDVPAWQITLQSQLMKQEQCQLSYFTGLNITGPKNFEKVEARAHCTDGRAFDIKGQKNTSKFELHACGPVLC